LTRTEVHRLGADEVLAATLNLAGVLDGLGGGGPGRNGEGEDGGGGECPALSFSP